MSTSEDTATQTPQCIYPIDPPHKSCEDYVKQFGHNGPPFFRRWFMEKQWAEGGTVVSWFSKSIASQTDKDNHVVPREKCVRNRALVRGDDKILSTVDKFNAECNQCDFFAENNNGFLKGIDAVGMYEYK